MYIFYFFFFIFYISFRCVRFSEDLIAGENQLALIGVHFFNSFDLFHIKSKCCTSCWKWFIGQMCTVKKPEPHTDRCEPHVARQFRNPHLAHISKFSVESDLYMIHVWIFVIHMWITMSHVWIFVSHVWITKIIWENCQLREIFCLWKLHGGCEL